jgi:Rrf2 family protein
LKISGKYIIILITSLPQDGGIQSPERKFIVRITTKGHLALRASLALAKLSRGKDLVTINTISVEENISPVFLEQIFFNLKNAGIIKSARGLGGGYIFAEPPDKVTVKEILIASGEDITAGFCEKHNENCPRETFCIAHNVWIQFDKLIDNYFQSLTIKGLLEQDPEVLDCPVEPDIIA